MTAETLTCPYCNASLGIQAGWSAGQRIVCPRCGDSFLLRLDDAFTDRASSPQSSEAAPHILSGPKEGAATEASPPWRWSNRLVAAVVLGVMFFMASGGLIFMLMTQQQRRAYDTNRPPRRAGKQRGSAEAESIPVVVNVAPDKLAALGYLPTGVNFLFAARFPELLASPLGAQLLSHPIKVGEAALRLEKLPEWLGLRPGEIDHVVFAARIDEAVPPPFYVVVRTVAPYDEAQLRRRLKGTRVPSPSKKQLFSFRVPQLDIQLNAWSADEHTAVLALFADQLESLPPQPVEGLQQLPQELRALLKQRREPAAPVWIAGHSRAWNKTSAAVFLSGVKKEDLEKLASLRTFGVFIIPTLRAGTGDEFLLVKGAFACKDESAARGLEDYLRARSGAGPGFRTALDGPWLALQFQTGPDFLGRLITR